MSRPTKATVEYFPHHCRHGRVIFVLESKWGNDGYSAFYKLFEILGDTEGHAFNCRKEGSWDYLVALLKIDEAIASEIIDKLCDLGIYDKDLWEQNRVLWSDCFVEDLEEVYSRRKVGIPVKPSLCTQKPQSTGIMEPEGEHKPTYEMEVDESKVNKKNTFAVTYNFTSHSWENVNGQLDIWTKAFPAVNIQDQLNLMASWLEANPKNRKSNYTRFIHNWLTRAQDKAPTVGQAKPDQGKSLRFDAQKCHTKCHGTCASRWDRHKDDPFNMCHWCTKFDHMRTQI